MSSMSAQWGQRLRCNPDGVLYALSNVLDSWKPSGFRRIRTEVSLIARLIRRPRWLLGFACDRWILHQGGRLALGGVVFVMPIIASA